MLWLWNVVPITPLVKEVHTYTLSRGTAWNFSCDIDLVCAGFQCHGWVLLGTVPCRVKLRWPKDAQYIETYHHAWIHWKTCCELEECGLSYL